MAEASSVDTALHPEEYDVIIIGSAVYMGHWMEEAVEFVQRNRDILRDRPVWIFSSGPLELGPGITSVNDPQLEPHEITVLRETIHPREHRIFFGALDPGKLGIKHRTLRKLPAARAILPEGDFRNWDEIESWVISIVRALESLQNTKKME
jgi:menaquinone-dependent protoporphyrinogen oxidase